MPATDQIVSKVPAHIVANARPASAANGGRICDYNIAAWLHAPGMADLPVTLLASYRDGGQQREVLIDHGTLNAHGKVLLSGIARLPYRQKIEEMQVRMRTAVGLSRFTVEEIFVQAVEQVTDSRTLASSLIP
ncbi:hypothetical protein [Pseudomonas panipatensis]|uniref:Uncharacterized protein n=1 Tax=Pseudomonas panipatensis TaxID=428992 RepID=A0A1G8GQL7_9PSED|nr:hypothetical protein [Pseudomonas panipatensis]SDH96561.1 hypothetical protein SAMN05216272_104413 [Pseudomonas panipatensis]SMP41988.1 hypothetical protein SAMN06295951_101572 [Pseudomonas panipatensis]